MKLILHDLSKDELKKCALPEDNDNISVISSDFSVKHCIGCFGCWIKTPGTCVINDLAGSFLEKLYAADELYIISKNTYGGFSSDIKVFLDRSIGYILPYFIMLNGEMHHDIRVKKSTDIHTLIYGKNINDYDKETMRMLVEANALNFSAKKHTVTFFEDASMIKEVFK